MFNILDLFDYNKTKEFWTSFNTKLVKFMEDWSEDVKASINKK